MSEIDLGGFLPLTPITFHILLALAGKPLHGYGVMKEVRERTEGQIKLETGTLYAALKRLRDEGWIEAVPDEERPEDEDQRRRSYRLTNLGFGVLRAEANRHARMVELATEKRLLDPKPA